MRRRTRWSRSRKLRRPEARMALPRYLTHSIWQVRMYAARAAGALAALDELNQLARDTHDNVREAALGELITLKRPEALRSRSMR